jgi:site-specific DNA-methyltransferase (adenine-specific)
MELNKIYNVDCLEFMKSMPDNSVDLIVTDPPYGMSFQSNYRLVRHKKIENDSSLDWLSDFILYCFRVLKDNSHLYFFCSFHNVDVFKQSAEKYFKVKNMLIWEKNNTGMGDLAGDFAPKYELILFCVKGNRILNGKRDSNILKFKKTGNELHPTQKPIELMEFLIKKSSSESDIVFDPFIGSGTTAVACLNTNRKFLGCEIDKEYFDIAEKRIKATEKINKSKLF